MFSAPAWLMMLVCFAETPAPPADRLSSREANEFICGPRCVQRVLEHYGQRVELIDLVQELQGAAIDRPATLAGMKQSLQQRGVSAVGVRIRPNELRWLDWPDPVIAHFGGSGSIVGHFCVVFPARTNSKSLCVWDGLAGESMRPAGELTGHASGFVLLTSRLPIADRPQCLNRSGLLLPVGAMAVILPTLVVFLVRAAWRRA